jgi:hypothetical protein
MADHRTDHVPAIEVEPLGAVVDEADTDETDDGFDRQTFELFGQIVSANVAHTQWATDRVIEHEKREKVRLARDLVRLYAAVDKAAAIVTTRALEETLNSLYIAYEDALRILREADPELLQELREGF